MDLPFLPLLWQDLAAGMASFLHQRAAWRLAVLLTGALFAKGRRTVTSWLRAAHVGSGFAPFYSFLAALGRRADCPAGLLLQRVLQRLAPAGPLLFAVDDTPTPRYGPHVQGAGVHHNPTPGPTDQRFLYGHVWVTLALVALHPLWGAIGLPLRALLYVRRKDLPRVPARQGWVFRTKLELAAELVAWAARLARFLGRAVRVVADGFYAKRPFLKPAARAGVAVISRLRRDAGLRTLPVPPRGGRRRPGRPPTYGSGRISLAKRAGQKRGWQRLECRQYGGKVVKQVKTFLATWRPAGGLIRVVLVREDKGWLAYFCTDANVSVAAVLEVMADRSAIEQTFHDVKEVWGAGQQQVRNVYANAGAMAVNLLWYSLVEAWAWLRREEELVARPAWDEEARRPSHADKRRALQREILSQEIRAAVGERPQWQEFQEFTTRLLDLAA